MYFFFWVCLLALIAAGTECDDTQIDNIFLELSPSITGLDFTAVTGPTCDAAKTIMKNGDTYSDAFLDSFCSCAIYTGSDVLSLAGTGKHLFFCF